MEKGKLYTVKTEGGYKKQAAFFVKEFGRFIVVADLYGETHYVTKEDAEKAVLYEFKRGEKTLFAKQMKKVEKYLLSREKEEELHRKNGSLYHELVMVMEEYETSKEAFTQKTITHLWRERGYGHCWVHDKKGEESLLFGFKKEIERYARVENYPFLYAEYDMSVHHRNFEVSEYFDVSLSGGLKEKLEAVAKKHGWVLSVNAAFSLGEKQTIDVGIDFTLKPKKKFTFKSFEALLDDLTFLKNVDEERDLDVKKKW